MSLIQLHTNDNVLVAKAPLAIGQEASAVATCMELTDADKNWEKARADLG